LDRGAVACHGRTQVGRTEGRIDLAVCSPPANHPNGLGTRDCRNVRDVCHT
jgi:hypothetical protein